MDGASPEPTPHSSECIMNFALPKHRTAAPLSSAMFHGDTSSRPFASQEQLGTHGSGGRQVPGSKRSVRFLGLDDMQVDGPGIKYRRVHATPAGGSHESDTSMQSHKISMESLVAKFNGTPALDTVVHRSNARAKPLAPFVSTNVEAFPDSIQKNIVSSPGSSSTTSGRDANSFWSPVSTASTAATSFGSPHSLASRYARATPEDVRHSSKGFGHWEESALPPIEEDSRRFLLIPVQDATVEGIVPSIATAENAAAAKCALELHFNNLLMSGSSPRSIRRKKLEQRMRDLGFDMIRVLGRGSFGVVRLVTERHRSNTPKPSSDVPEASVDNDSSMTDIANSDGKAKRTLPSGKPISDVFAMKVIRKSEMLRSCQEGHLRAERDFLVAAEGSTWVVPLLASFQDNTNLYLVMEYMIGGDFLGMLLREDVLDELVAR
ncbi:uncharacterized protein RCC_00246 [Ramularia collo-cygni]|uniref:non-specific serine/threonine protein kinase n=1 Tax=Ramularia collo-cygni TaxID=112498 RepID=A0A2D3ULT9_9PEZI|nr:uncharacterized protein RCC_00246 [Ramularia collo-cygni]CZT14271.1 uncharacterized protein RCC_00246 [Ramularia collo-cygni]